MLQTLKFKLTSDAPLLMHNGEYLANPTSKASKDLKRLTSKKDRTDADYEEMAKIEWYASLYVDIKTGKICLPSEVIEAAVIQGAKKTKRGKTAQSTVFVPENPILHFDGEDLSIDELWKRNLNRWTTMARVQGRGRIPRTRPRFDSWWCEITLKFDDKLLNPLELTEVVNTTGEIIGLCDWRPKFGRFTAEKIT